MIIAQQKRPMEDFSRIFDVSQDGSGFNAFLVNRGMYINSTNIPPSMVTVHSVEPNDTYTKISYKYYDTIDLWWLVCKMNNVVNPFEQLQTGTLLKILNKQYVQKMIFPAMDKMEKLNAKSNVNVN